MNLFWRMSAVISVVQLLAGGVAYYFIRDSRAAALLACAATIIMLNTAYMPFERDIVGANVFATLSIMFPALWVALLLVSFLFALSASGAVHWGQGRPGWVLLILSLPLGIGTVLGGLILLGRKKLLEI